MRMILAVAAVLYSASAFAQTDKPPMVGDKPLVQVKPKGTKTGTKEAAAKPAAAPKGKPQSVAVRMQACLELDDGTEQEDDGDHSVASLPSGWQRPHPVVVQTEELPHACEGRRRHRQPASPARASVSSSRATRRD